MKWLACLALLTAIACGRAAAEPTNWNLEPNGFCEPHLLDDATVEKVLFPGRVVRLWLLEQVGIRQDYSHVIGIQTPAVNTSDLDIPCRRPIKLFGR